MKETAQPQAATEANRPGEATETVSEASGAQEIAEPFLTVKYNKQEKNLSRDEAREYAQKGMNYDKVSKRLNETAQKLYQYESGKTAQSGGRKRQESVNRQLNDFLKQNPGVDPRTLPQEVIGAWKNGVPLSEAAEKYRADINRSETQRLRKQIEQLKTNESNSSASMGRAHSNGSTQQKPLTAEAIRKMSRKEVEKDFDRIWEFLTGVKRKK